ncbi:MAG TPA: acetylxylan esterase [Bryobacteraceae bacterium]|nr:acetylxylan esterase [Bryobacteraceae bacterium]
MSKSIYFLPLLALASMAAQAPPGNYDEAKVGSYTLPDPLIFADGKPVRSAEDWKRRRIEILRLFEENVYGRSPQAPPKLDYEVIEQDGQALGGKATRKQVQIRYSSNPDAPKQNLLLYVPAAAAARKPVPVILTVSFYGNHAVSADPAIRLGTLWNPKTRERQPADPNTRGSMKGFSLEDLLARGYALATFYYQDIEPDFEGGDKHGIRPLLTKGEPAANGWGAIGAWAYAVSRAIDFLEKQSDIDSKRIAVLGHSRLGKTALWAAAQDPRIALVIANQAGEGGASLARRNYGETLADLNKRFPYWFTPNFGKFAERPSELPVDMHELVALIAPRPVYITGAEDDQWADPKGEFLSLVGAGPVYRLLGQQDLGTNIMPGLNQPIHRTLGFHYRNGKHEVNAYDWEQFLKFTDMHFMKSR